MKLFSTYITELEQEWHYMRKPRPQAAVDEFGRTINVPALPKPERTATAVPDTPNTQRKNISRLHNAPRGTEDAAEYRLRKQNQEPGYINTFPRKVGPPTDPEKEQRSTIDHTVTKKDTQDQMPEINVDEPPLKKRKRT